jgi:hypothetical protein
MAHTIPDVMIPTATAEELLQDGALAVDAACAFAALSRAELYLGGRLKTGHTWTSQDRP